MADYRSAFEAALADPRYLKNLDWGESREGHPEGTVRAHIAEIEGNLETLRPKLNEQDYRKLKLIIHTHDTFKTDAQPGVAINDPKSHTSLTRAFLADHCDDADLFAMVQYHDEPFEIYRQFETKGKYNLSRFNDLVGAIRDWNLFIAFNITYSCTGGKSREPLRWLFGELGKRVQSNFATADIIQ